MSHTSTTPLQASKEAQSFFDNRLNIITDLKIRLAGREQVRLEAVSVFLCTQGKGTFSVTNREACLGPGDLLICRPGSLLESRQPTPDFAISGFYLSRRFFEELSTIPLELWNSQSYIECNPVLHLSPQSTELFCHYYDLISSKLSDRSPLKHHQLVTTLLIQAFMYEFHDTLSNNIEVAAPHYTSADNLFRRFADLLLQSYPRPRAVKWYADRLHVTPKYLSTVCKQTCGCTASHLINRYVLEDVKRLLMRPEKSIKQIVVELEFPSISFFGKYVKKHLGMAPKFYRQRKDRGE